MILGEEPIPLDISTAELLKERNTVDECVAFMAKEFDDAANELPDRYDGSNLGRIDRAACKAFKAKMLLYAASPLFNCNPDYAAIVNPESGKQLFPQDKSQEKAKWEAARDAYKEFFDEYGNTFSLYTEKTADGKIDFYESYRKFCTVQRIKNRFSFAWQTMITGLTKPRLITRGTMIIMVL